MGEAVPCGESLFRKGSSDSYGRFKPLTDLDDKVTVVASRRGAYNPDAEYILGVDGGSTTTKAALVDADTLEIAAEHYGRTHGDPVAALKKCVREIQAQIGKDATPRISLVSTTGSSRELLGVFLETHGVYNEIIAHAVGTSFFDPNVDTIFEIGGQDAKYIRLENSVPIDYAMNEACSAGTGSFIEESAKGDLNIDDVQEIGPHALKAEGPLKFGEHCSAFINSDIRKAIQLGFSKEDVGQLSQPGGGQPDGRSSHRPPGGRGQEPGRAARLCRGDRTGDPGAAGSRADGLFRRRPARQAKGRGGIARQGPVYAERYSEKGDQAQEHVHL
jgi:activator of 2-hydroxyglutaryl-CoA dehydratase